MISTTDSEVSVDEDYVDQIAWEEIVEDTFGIDVDEYYEDE